MDETASRFLRALASRLNELADLVDIDGRSVSAVVAQDAESLSHALYAGVELLEHPTELAQPASPINDRLFDALRGAFNLCQTLSRSGYGEHPPGERLRSASRAILRELDKRQPTGEGASDHLPERVNGSPVEVERDKKTEARDKWIYDQVASGISYSTISSKLKKKPKGWGRISTDNGIKKAALRFAKRHGKPIPGPRKAGRRSN